MLKQIGFTILLLFVTSISFCQRGYDVDYESDDISDFQRYAHFRLSGGEFLAIVIGIILLLIAKNMTDINTNLRRGVGCLGLICSLPLILVILALTQKAMGYALVLAIVVGGLYYLFNQDNK
jgi:hypothetical protein